MKMMRKAASLNVDTIVLDLEDGVAVSKKDEARRNVMDFLSDPTVDIGNSELLV
jgi:citrate lyase beta subunit